MRIALACVLAVACSKPDRGAIATKVEDQFRRKDIAAKVSVRDRTLVIGNFKLDTGRVCAPGFESTLRAPDGMTAEDWPMPTIDFAELERAGFNRIECEDGTGMAGADLPIKKAK